MAWNNSDLHSPQFVLPATAGGGQQQQQQQEHQSFANVLLQYDYNCFNHPFPAGTVKAELMEKLCSTYNHENPWVAASCSEGSTANTTTSTTNNHNEEVWQRKTRLTNDQLNGLERSFQEELKLEEEQQQGTNPLKKRVKLEPERKMLLATELGLHPRQVSIWFQNRRAKFKAQQLQGHYDALKKEFDIVSRENHNLQQEVSILKAKLADSTTLEKQDSTRCMEMLVEEKVVEDTSMLAIPLANSSIQLGSPGSGGNSYFFSTDDNYSYSTNSLPYWDAPYCLP